MSPRYQCTARPALHVTQYTSIYLCQPSMSHRISAHSPVCYPGYQYTALHVTQYTSTQLFEPGMSAMVSVHSSASPACHPVYYNTAQQLCMSPSRLVHSSPSPVCHPRYQYTALPALHVTQCTSTQLYQPYMSLPDFDTPSGFWKHYNNKLRNKTTSGVYHFKALILYF